MLCSAQGTIQIHVYLILPPYSYTPYCSIRLIAAVSLILSFRRLNSRFDEPTAWACVTLLSPRNGGYFGITINVGKANLEVNVTSNFIRSAGRPYTGWRNKNGTFLKVCNSCIG